MAPGSGTKGLCCRIGDWTGVRGFRGLISIVLRSGQGRFTGVGVAVAGTLATGLQ